MTAADSNVPRASCALLIRNIVRGALLADRQVHVVPPLLRRAVLVLAQRVLAFELHHDGLLHPLLALILEVAGPDALDAGKPRRKLARGVDGGLDLLRSR